MTPVKNYCHDNVKAGNERLGQTAACKCGLKIYKNNRWQRRS